MLHIPRTWLNPFCSIGPWMLSHPPSQHFSFPSCCDDKSKTCLYMGLPKYICMVDYFLLASFIRRHLAFLKPKVILNPVIKLIHPALWHSCLTNISLASSAGCTGKFVKRLYNLILHTRNFNATVVSALVVFPKFFFFLLCYCSHGI